MAAQFLGIREDWEETIQEDVYKREMVARARIAGLAKDFLMANNIPYLKEPMERLYPKLRWKYKLDKPQVQALIKFLRLKYQEGDDLDLFAKEITQLTMDWLNPIGKQGDGEDFIISTVSCVKFFESLHEDLQYKVIEKRPMSLAMAIYFAKEIVKGEQMETSQEKDQGTAAYEIMQPIEWEPVRSAPSVTVADQMPVNVDVEEKQREKICQIAPILEVKPLPQNSSSQLNNSLIQEKGTKMIKNTKSWCPPIIERSRKQTQCKKRYPKIKMHPKKDYPRFPKRIKEKEKTDNKKIEENKIWKKGWPNRTKKKRNSFHAVRKKRRKYKSVFISKTFGINRHGLRKGARKPPRKPTSKDMTMWIKFRKIRRKKIPPDPNKNESNNYVWPQPWDVGWPPWF